MNCTSADVNHALSGLPRGELQLVECEQELRLARGAGVTLVLGLLLLLLNRVRMALVLVRNVWRRSWSDQLLMAAAGRVREESGRRVVEERLGERTGEVVVSPRVQRVVQAPGAFEQHADLSARRTLVVRDDQRRSIRVPHQVRHELQV